MSELTKDQWFLLEWLSKEESSAYGECYGHSLDGLVQLGLAQLGPIPFGRSEEYRPVALTDAGFTVYRRLAPTQGKDEG